MNNLQVIILCFEFLFLCLGLAFTAPHLWGAFGLKTVYGELIFRIISITCSTVYLVCIVISCIGYLTAVTEDSQKSWGVILFFGLFLFLCSLGGFIKSIHGLKKSSKTT
jgi:hypothetical protein